MKTRKAFSVRDIVLLPLLSAMLIVFQVVLAPLPNIEVVSLLIIVYTLFYRCKALVIIYIFAAAEIAIYGFGFWSFTYLYVWTVLWAVIMLLPRNLHPVLYAVVSGAFGLFFGTLCVLAYVAIGDFGMALSSWLSGLSFDLLHCVGNFFIALFLFRPLYSLFSWYEKKSAQRA